MLEKIKELGKKDELIFHKIGMIAGGVLGILLGLVISEKADQYEIEELEEIIDGSTKA